MAVDDWKDEFWAFLCQNLIESDDWYSRFTPPSIKAMGWKTGVPGIGLWFRLRKNYVEVTVTIEKTGIDRIEFFWEQLKEYQTQIDTNLTIKPEWLPASGRVTASRIATKVHHPGTDDDVWWVDVVEPLRLVMDEYRRAILPIIDGLDDLQTTHYYVIRITDRNGDEIVWKAGITNYVDGRFKTHRYNFANDSRSKTWNLELVDWISFDNEKNARAFETMIKNSSIRAPKMPDLSHELFTENPLQRFKP